MGCDMVVALGQVPANRQQLFGINLHATQADWPILRRFPGRDHAAGSTVKAQRHELPQVRQTLSVLGCGPWNTWGFSHGINERQVAAAVACWRSKIVPTEPGLDGTDLVRLVLERSHSVSQAMDVLADLIARHGQGQPGREAPDHIFLIADGHEAMLVEAAGSYWASLECHEVRAVSDTALIRQDWQRLAPGLAEHVIARGWWQDDGNKLDFSGCLAAHPLGQDWALKRWGRATLALEQQNGHIDLWFLRRMLTEHFEAVVAPQPMGRPRPALVATFLTALSAEADAVPLAWCAFGPPREAIFFPVFLDGELPPLLEQSNISGPGFLRRPPALEKARGRRAELDRWQAYLDQKTEDFLPRARSLKSQGNLAELQRQTTLFMNRLIEGAETEGEHPSLQRPAASGQQDLAYVLE